VTTDITGGNDSSSALALQPDGKIVVAGSGVLARYQGDERAPPNVAVAGGECRRHDNASAAVELLVGDADWPAGDLTVSATSSDQTLLPDSDGDDGLFGHNGADALGGGPGADHFSGGRGPDTLGDHDPGQGDTTDGT
jgi:hypothetical protein